MSRLRRETNPTPGFSPGVLPQHQKTDGTFAVTGENNPLPVRIYGPNGNPISSTNRLPVDAQLTGSKVEVIQYGEELTIPPGVMIYVPNSSLAPDVLNKRYAVLIKLTGVSTPNRKFEVILNYRRYNEGVKDGNPRYLMAVETVITATGETGTPTMFVSPLRFVPAEWFNAGIRNNAEVDITLSWYIVEV